jgi:TATA-box binding protein (TBP) (component of TFIID and TFIIIB)
MEVDGGDSGDGASVVFSLYRLLAFMGDMCTLTGKFPAAFLSLPAMRDEATGLQWPAITATIFARGSFLIMGFNQIADIDMAVVHLDYWINKAFSGAGGPYKVASSEVVNIATSVSLAGRLPLGPFMHWIANGHADKILVEYEPSIFPAAFITVLGDYWYNKERDIAAKKAEQLLAKKRRDAAAALPAGQMPRRRRRSTTKKPKNAKKIKLKRSLFFGTGKVIIVGQRVCKTRQIASRIVVTF